MSGRPVDDTEVGALAQWAPQVASVLASLVSDIVLVVDADGTIRDVAIGAQEPLSPEAAQWVGRHWPETVSSDTRIKIERLLREVTDTGVARRREVNHVSADGADIPVAYTAVRLGRTGPLLAVGQDLRTIAAIQQRFLDAQQEIERNYWRKQQAESRYRLLFQVATDPVLVVDGETLRILEANPAAGRLFGAPVESLAGGGLGDFFTTHSQASLEDLMTRVRATGEPAELPERLAAGQQRVSVAVSALRGARGLLLLVRVRHGDSAAGPRPDGQVGDAVVVTDAAGRIHSASHEFLCMAGLGAEDDAAGRTLAEWVGEPGRDLDAIIALVRRHGIARQVRTVLRGGDGRLQEVELSAALLTEGEQEGIGFTLHRVLSRLGNADDIEALSTAAGSLIDRLGEVSLPGLMREAGVLLERQFLGAALERCAGDMEAAARLLGVERDNLELRLRRHQFALTPGDGDQPAPPGSR